MSYREYLPPAPLLVGYDPYLDLPSDHLARFVESVVEQSITIVTNDGEPGQPKFDLRLLLKVLLYGYLTGVRSSRQMERLCDESLAYLFLSRGDTPSYRTLCSTRVKYAGLLEEVWTCLLAVAAEHGITRCGKIVLDSSKWRANASPDAVVKAADFVALQAELTRILKEAEVVDRREDQEDAGGTTRLGTPIKPDQMRDIVRRVRAAQAEQSKVKSAGEAGAGPAGEAGAGPAGEAGAGPAGEAGAGPAGEAPLTADPKLEMSSKLPASADKPVVITRKMFGVIEAALDALKSAQEEGLKHLCLTDPDARMMPEGREKRIRECHSFEVAVDQGLLVVAQTTSQGSDNSRLMPIIDAARPFEPEGIKAVDADSGYWRGDDVASLVASGIDTCIPDSHTACDLHRALPVGTTKERVFSKVPMIYDPQADTYSCPEGNILKLLRTTTNHGQEVKEYRATDLCTDCPLAAVCLQQKTAKRRHLEKAVRSEQIQAVLDRFNEPEHRKRYRRRGDCVETVFGFIRSVLGITRWQLRGSDRVAAEGKLIACAYQIRKIHSKIRAAT